MPFLQHPFSVACGPDLNRYPVLLWRQRGIFLHSPCLGQHIEFLTQTRKADDSSLDFQVGFFALRESVHQIIRHSGLE